jgi:alpha-ketoglutarate-dependent taurine dioxygenase
MSDLLKKIENLPHRITPVASKKVTMQHSDGLSQTHYHDTYSDDVENLKKEIWQSDLPFLEKMSATEMLASKMKI